MGPSRVRLPSRKIRILAGRATKIYGRESWRARRRRRPRFSLGVRQGVRLIRRTGRLLGRPSLSRLTVSALLYKSGRRCVRARLRRRPKGRGKGHFSPKGRGAELTLPLTAV